MFSSAAASIAQNAVTFRQRRFTTCKVTDDPETTPKTAATSAVMLMSTVEPDNAA